MVKESLDTKPVAVKMRQSKYQGDDIVYGIIKLKDPKGRNYAIRVDFLRETDVGDYLLPDDPDAEKVWEFEFSLYPKLTDRALMRKIKDIYGLNKLGNERLIMATVLKFAKRFADKYKPAYVYFSAKESSRQKLYGRLVRIFASGMGYKNVTKEIARKKSLNQYYEDADKYYVLKRVGVKESIDMDLKDVLVEQDKPAREYGMSIKVPFLNKENLKAKMKKLVYLLKSNGIEVLRLKNEILEKDEFNIDMVTALRVKTELKKNELEHLIEPDYLILKLKEKGHAEPELHN